MIIIAVILMSVCTIYMTLLHPSMMVIFGVVIGQPWISVVYVCIRVFDLPNNKYNPFREIYVKKKILGIV